jgi:hypothetical protein
LASRIDLSVFYNPPLGRSVLAANESPSTPETAKSHTRPEEQIEMTPMERLLEVEVGAYGTILEEIELICTMTGFRSRFLVHHMGEGFFRSVELSFG